MDLILQASSGLISMTGEPGGARVRCGHSVADVTAGLFAVIGILLALQSGNGQLVDVSMFDSMISAMSSNFANFFATGVAPEPMGTAFGTIVPYRTFATSDREIAIAVASERLWRAFCEVIGQDDLFAHPDYSTNALRVQNREKLEPMIAGIFLTATSEQWCRRLESAGIPCTVVRTLDQVAADPHAAARRMFVELEHPTAGNHKVTGAPVKLSQAPIQAQTPAPLLGDSTNEVLRELLHLNDAELNKLDGAGVIFQAQAVASPISAPQ
jgi:crotonobetainyl-CoA:carnitine CoA-transferase CaiB-like acyl-CoA transferase